MFAEHGIYGHEHGLKYTRLVYGTVEIKTFIMKSTGVVDIDVVTVVEQLYQA